MVNTKAMNGLSMKSIKRISIINTESGIELYKKDIGPSFFLKHDNQLISGFISALMNFSQSIVKEEIQEIIFANSRLYFKKFPNVIIVLMTTLSNGDNIINKVIDELGNQIETSGKIPRLRDPISQKIMSFYDELITETLKQYEKTVQFSPAKKPKIVIAGPKKAGKTTAIHKFFYSWNEDELNTITPTVDYSILHSFLDVLKTELTIFDLGGQEQYINNHLSMEMKWKEAAAIIFMIDISQPEEFPEANDYLMKILKVLKSQKEEPFIGLFAHKYDPDKASELQPNLQKFLEIFRGIRKWPRYSIFLSSIYDESLHLAFIRTISRAIPRNLLQNILESAIFFETQNEVWEIISNQLNIDRDTHVLKERIIELAVPYGEKLAYEVLNDWLTNNQKIGTKPLQSSLTVKIADIQSGICVNVELTKEDNIPVTLAVIEGLFTGLGSYFGLTKIKQLKTTQTTNKILSSWSLEF